LRDDGQARHGTVTGFAGEAIARSGERDAAEPIITVRPSPGNRQVPLGLSIADSQQAFAVMFLMRVTPARVQQLRQRDHAGQPVRVRPIHHRRA
jgi:hypothetical protein